jgi:dTDP-glucose 4,6-dehydratase
VLDVARKTIEVIGSASPIRHVESMTDDPRRRRPDISLAEHVLQWQPGVPLDEGLRSFAREFAG